MTCVFCLQRIWDTSHICSGLFSEVYSMFIYFLAMHLVFSDSVCLFLTRQPTILFILHTFTLSFLYIKKSVSKCSFYLVCYIYFCYDIWLSFPQEENRNDQEWWLTIKQWKEQMLALRQVSSYWAFLTSPTWRWFSFLSSLSYTFWHWWGTQRS